MVIVPGLIMDPESLRLQPGAPAFWTLVNLFEICNLFALLLSLFIVLNSVPSIGPGARV